MWKVKPSDCRTGFMVVNTAGKVYAIYRQRGFAAQVAAELNGRDA